MSFNDHFQLSIIARTLFNMKNLPNNSLGNDQSFKEAGSRGWSANYPSCLPEFFNR